MTNREVNAAVRESLGLPPKPEPQSTVPQEGHICDFPIWSYSKKRSTITKLMITYEDGSFFQLEAPKGLPGVSSPGYLDILLYLGFFAQSPDRVYSRDSTNQTHVGVPWIAKIKMTTCV